MTAVAAKYSAAEFRSAIARNVRNRRLELGLSQVELAERLGCSQVRVSLIERGARGMAVEDLPALADALEAKVSELVTPEKFARVPA